MSTRPLILLMTIVAMVTFAIVTYNNELQNPFPDLDLSFFKKFDPLSYVASSGEQNPYTDPTSSSQQISQQIKESGSDNLGVPTQAAQEESGQWSDRVETAAQVDTEPDETTQMKASDQATDQIAVTSALESAPKAPNETEFLVSSETRELDFHAQKAQANTITASIGAADASSTKGGTLNKGNQATEASPVIDVLTSLGIRESSIMNWDSNGYTIQISTASTEEHAQQYIDHHGLGPDTTYYLLIRNDRTWYPVVFGAFSSYKSAEEALEGLPKQVRDAKPWVRQIRNIQNSILERKTTQSQ